MLQRIVADSEEPTGQDPRYVVGVTLGLSGLEALDDLLDGFSATTPVAAVVVAHPAQLSAESLVGLRARERGLKAVFPESRVALAPGHVYVAGGARRWTVSGGVLSPSDGAPPGDDSHHYLDAFFRSLAADQRDRAVGVILSGEGADGASGLQAIKAAGGLTLVQQPDGQGTGGMLHSALAAGSIDVCDAPKALAAAIKRLSGTGVDPPVGAQRAKLATLLRARLGVDLGSYKPATVDRRLGRRMMLRNTATLPEYLQLLDSDPAELGALRRDLLLTVTAFFRDGEPFEAVSAEVLPRLLERRTDRGPLRIWAPACATGQEAYSLAICALEALEARGDDRALQVFGTDAEEGSIAFARRGLYPPSIAAEVSAERLARFFVPRDDGSWQISREVREKMTFSQHDLLSDPPFSRIDLVSCRNLLIYLQPAAQHRVLRSLHFALAPQGALLLGTSETIGEAEGLFSLLDRKNKLYSRKAGLTLPLPLGNGPPSPRIPSEASPMGQARALGGTTDRILIEQYAPASVVVGEHLEVVLFRGQTGPFIEPASGAASFQLLRVTPIELHAELKRITEAALKDRVRASGEVSLSRGGTLRTVRLDAQPIGDVGAAARFALVVFEERSREADPATGTLADHDAALASRVRQLERDLASSHRYLQECTEENGSAAEDLRAANEELQSSNEELHSANEELEVSRAELQSTNEDLVATNDVLHDRNEELTRINDDLHNVLVVVEHAVLILGRRLELLRFNAAAARLLKLDFDGVGLPLRQLDRLLGRPAEDALAELVATGSIIDSEVLAPNGAWHALRIKPYRALDGAVKGAVVTLVDIDTAKRARDQARDVREYALRFLGQIQQPLLILDAGLKVQWANSPWYSQFELTPEEAVGVPLGTVGGVSWKEPGLLARLGAAARGGDAVEALRLNGDGNGALELSLNAHRIPVSTASSLLLVSVKVGS